MIEPSDELIYADYAAASPVYEEVLKAMQPYWQNQFYNPSGLSRQSRSIREVIESCRATVAKILQVKSNEIIFTSGATESNNLVINTFYQIGNFGVAAIEHPSILEPSRAHGGTEFPVDEKVQPIIGDEQLKAFSVAAVNHELGTIQNLRRIKQALPVDCYLHTDASQAVLCQPLASIMRHCDYLSLNGGKIGGPKGSGCLAVRNGSPFSSLWFGGSQEQGRRPATENVPAIVGFSKALEITQNKAVQTNQKLFELRDYFLEQLRQKSIPFIDNANTKTSPHIVSLQFPDHDGERLLLELDAHGIIVATGSACTASDDLPSHVLLAVGLSEKQANATLRFSFSSQMSTKQVDKIVEAFVDIT
jgi:cysteine desulfurase